VLPAAAGLVNDVKKFRIGDGKWVPDGDFTNTRSLWYALSRDGKTFAPPRELCTRQGEADAFMVAWDLWSPASRRRRGGACSGFCTARVRRRAQRQPHLRTVVAEARRSHAGDELFESSSAMGPDSQFVALSHPVTAPLELYAEDGVTLIGRSAATQFVAGKAYRITFE
jgi:hypothetical protein